MCAYLKAWLGRPHKTLFIINVQDFFDNLFSYKCSKCVTYIIYGNHWWGLFTSAISKRPGSYTLNHLVIRRAFSYAVKPILLNSVSLILTDAKNA